MYSANDAMLRVVNSCEMVVKHVVSMWQKYCFEV